MDRTILLVRAMGRNSAGVRRTRVVARVMATERFSLLLEMRCWSMKRARETSEDSWEAARDFSLYVEKSEIMNERQDI